MNNTIATIDSILANPANWLLDFSGPFAPSYPNTYSNSKVRCTWICRFFPKTGKRVAPGIFYIDCHTNGLRRLEIGIQHWLGGPQSFKEIPTDGLPADYDLFDTLDLLKEMGFEINFCASKLASKCSIESYNPCLLRQTPKDRLGVDNLYKTFIW